MLFGVEQTNYRDKVAQEKMQEIIILRTPKEKYPKKVQLLLMFDLNNRKKHCVVKNLSRLLASQVTKHKGKRHFCTFCLNGFKTEKSLENHLDYCSTCECGKTIFPDGEKIIDFIKLQNYQKIHEVPFVIYADFECFLKPVDIPSGEKKTQFQKHKPSGFGFIVKSFDDRKSENAVRYTKHHENEVFLKYLCKSWKKLLKKYMKNLK